MSEAAERQTLAAMNNAVGCDTVCRAHGQAGVFHDACWVHRGRVPRFTSNLTTLAGAASSGAQLRQIASIEPDIGRHFSIKDGFCALDLSAQGFEVRFEASWIWRDPGRALPPAGDRVLEWSPIERPDQLDAWEAAWNGNAANAGQAGPDASPRQFPPALLDDPAVFFAGRGVDGALAAVGIANRSGPVVGLSNVFAGDASQDPGWPGLLRAVARRFPGLPMVGYERGDDLGRATDAGFEAFAPLRVWVR